MMFFWIASSVAAELTPADNAFSFSAFPQVYPKPVLVNRSFSTYIRVQKKALSIDSTGLTGGDHAFVEVAHSAVRIIAACPQYNCPLLSHGLVGGLLAHAAC